MAQHNNIGKLGEDIAIKWLKDNKFTIIERNYRKKWGEIDIIAKLGGIIHFIEVKAVSYETRAKIGPFVPHETYRPEDNVHTEKLKRLSRAISTWILEKNLAEKWQIDVVTVKTVPREKYARVNLIENVILE